MNPLVRTLALAGLVALLGAGAARAQEAAGSGDGGDADSDAGASSGGDDSGASALVSPTSNALVAIRRSEPRSQVALSVGASVNGQANRGGLQRGALELEGSWAPARTWELFTTLNAMAFRSLIVNGQGQDQVRVGSMTVGATWVPFSLSGGRFDGGFFLRFLLPTSNELSGVHAWGFQPGLTFRGMATRWLAWFGGFSYRVSQSWGSIETPLAVRSASATQTGVSAMLGVTFVPAPWLRLVAQCSGNAPFSRGNDTLSPGLSVRFVDGPFVAEIGAVLPLGGVTRSFSSVAKVSWRLGG